MRLIIIFATVLLLLQACSKSSSVSNGKSYPDSLPGKWWYVEYFASAGPPGSWYPVNPVTQWIELKANGIVYTNMDTFKDATGYELPDSNKIKFVIPSNPQGYLLFLYKIDSTQPALILSPLNPICIEGCAIKFKRRNK